MKRGEVLVQAPKIATKPQATFVTVEPFKRRFEREGRSREGRCDDVDEQTRF